MVNPDRLAVPHGLRSMHPDENQPRETSSDAGVRETAVPAKENDDTQDITLTPREKECMLWTLRGKTAWETGAILGISQETEIGTAVFMPYRWG
jgi:hypothetical protein